MRTDKLADELEALAEKASSRGPWKVTSGLGIEATPDRTSDYDPVVIGGCKGGKGMIHFPSYSEYSTPGRNEGEANAALIVALVNNLPAITAALRDAGRVRRLEEALKRITEMLHDDPACANWYMIDIARAALEPQS